MDAVKRYQVYLNPRAVSVLDEAAEAVDVARSLFLREAAEAAADRLGNMLAMLKPVKNTDFDWLDRLCGSINTKSKKLENYSERPDSFYYSK